MCELEGCGSPGIRNCEGCDFRLCGAHCKRLPKNVEGVFLYTCPECVEMVLGYERAWSNLEIEKLTKIDADYTRELKEIKGTDACAKSKVAQLRAKHRIDHVRESRTRKLRYITRLEKYHRNHAQ